MKKTLFIVLTIFCTVFSSCVKQDLAEMYAGEYSINSTGNLTFYFGSETQIVPISGNNESLTIMPTSTPGMINVSGWYSCNGSVTENTFHLDSETNTQTEDGMVLTMTISHRTGTKSGNMLTWQSDVSATLYYDGYTSVGNGTIQNVATKIGQ